MSAYFPYLLSTELQDLFGNSFIWLHSCSTSSIIAEKYAYRLPPYQQYLQLPQSYPASKAFYSELQTHLSYNAIILRMVRERSWSSHCIDLVPKLHHQSNLQKTQVEVRPSQADLRPVFQKLSTVCVFWESQISPRILLWNVQATQACVEEPSSFLLQ